MANTGDIEYLKTIVEAHNAADATGVDTGSEAMQPSCVLQYKGIIYVCVNSLGGYANDWIARYMEDNSHIHKPLKIFWPWQKPRWWGETEAVDVEQLDTSQEIKTALNELLEPYKHHFKQKSGGNTPSTIPVYCFPCA